MLRNTHGGGQPPVLYRIDEKEEKDTENDKTERRNNADMEAEDKEEKLDEAEEKDTEIEIEIGEIEGKDTEVDETGRRSNTEME